MGQTRQHFPTLLFAALFSQDPSAIAWGRKRFEERSGPVLLESPLFEFSETEFYQATMGTGLKKQFLVFQYDFDPATLADWKLLSNQWEAEYRDAFSSTVERPLNLDPGYLSEAKLVLATTKDRDHRIYLRDGIYAEVTLFYLRTGWQYSRWTYPDYRRADVHDFLTKARNLLREQKESGPAANAS